MANGATAASIDNLDSVVITYSEVIDPTTVHASLVPGGSVTGVTGATTVGNILVDQSTSVATVYGVTTFDTGASVATGVSATTMTYALDSTGKALTLTFTAMTGGGVITTPNNGAGTQIAGVKDVNANNSGTPATPASTGAF